MPPGFAPLRVWLEPGYDGGRVGGWALDVPGVFGSARTPERALTAALSATGRVREWLEARSEALDLPPVGGIEVAGEMPAVREPDGYERNATFDPDRRAVTGDELDTVIRRLGWLREDLVVLAAQVSRHEVEHGPLADDGDGDARTSDAVLRHLAGAEVWLVGRLDGSVRYDGPLRDDPVAAALDATRAWTLAQLRARRPGDVGREVADRHGETWTLAKVLRRLVYHSFDHLWELDRRLALADGSADRVQVTLDRRPPTGDAVALLRGVGWDVHGSDPAALEQAVRGSSERAAAWDGDRLVGIARSMSDGALNALIAMVVVQPRYQGLGVGGRLMSALIDGRDGVRFSLSAAAGVDEWYRKLGFVPDPHAMVRPRRRR
jgi:Acetyltransferase (GNAT) domain